jgi:hypothetical protein
MGAHDLTAHREGGLGAVDHGDLASEAGDAGQPSSRRTILYVVAGCLVAAALAFLMLGGSNGDSGQTADTTLPPVAETITASDAPTNLKVEDQGTSAVVTWETNLPTDTEFAVQWEDENGDSEVKLGRSGYVAEGLDAELSYCFTVSTVTDDLDQLTVKRPVGIRGATCESTATPP